MRCGREWGAPRPRQGLAFQGRQQVTGGQPKASALQLPDLGPIAAATWGSQGRTPIALSPTKV